MKKSALNEIIRLARVSAASALNICAVVQQEGYVLLVRPKTSGTQPSPFDLVTVPHIPGEPVEDALEEAIYTLTSRHLMEVESFVGSYERINANGDFKRNLAFLVLCDDSRLKMMDQADYAWVNASCVDDYVVEPDIRDFLRSVGMLNLAA